MPIIPATSTTESSSNGIMYVEKSSAEMPEIFCWNGSYDPEIVDAEKASTRKNIIAATRADALFKLLTSSYHYGEDHEC